MTSAKKKALNLTFNIAVVLVGTFVMAFGNMAFLWPRNVVPGGFTGFAMLISELLGRVFSPSAMRFFTPGIISIVLNIPLFLVAYKMLGNKFGVLSILGTVSYSVFIDLIPRFGWDLSDITSGDGLLATVYGGALLGIGYGVIVRQGGSTGGSDMLANIIQSKKPALSFGSIVLIIDGIVVAMSALVFSISDALYAFVTIFLASTVADYIIDGKRSTKVYFIVSKNPKEMADAIFKGISRGVTALRGVGMFTGEEKEVLMCVVQRTQSAALRTIIHEIDPSAFVFSQNNMEAYGEGFIKLPEDKPRKSILDDSDGEKPPRIKKQKPVKEKKSAVKAKEKSVKPKSAKPKKEKTLKAENQGKRPDAEMPESLGAVNSDAAESGTEE